MIKVYDTYDNIRTDSEHNAAMISAYLHNLARDLECDLTDEQYGLLCRASDLVWILKKNLTED